MNLDFEYCGFTDALHFLNGLSLIIGIIAFNSLIPYSLFNSFMSVLDSTSLFSGDVDVESSECLGSREVVRNKILQLLQTLWSIVNLKLGCLEIRSLFKLRKSLLILNLCLLYGSAQYLPALNLSKILTS